MSRQRVWYAADALFTSDPKIADLGDRWGPAGPLVIVALHGLAKLAADHGTVKARVGMLTRYAFLPDCGQAAAILLHAKSLGIVEGLGFSDDDTAFTLTFPHWDRWQKSNDALRKSRERGAEEKETDAEKHAIECAFVYWQETMEGQKAKLTKQRRTCLRARLRAGYSFEDIVRAIDGCAGSDFHMGRGEFEGRTFNDLTLICKNDQKLEEFMARPAGTQTPDLPDDDPEAMYR